MCYTRDLVQYPLLLSVAWASALRSCLTDVNPQDISLSLHALFLLLLPLPELTSLYLDTSDCFPTKGLLLIKNKTKKTNRTLFCLIVMFPIYMRKKKKKNQPPLPLLCSQRLGSILFPFVRGTTMEGLFSLCLTPEVLSQGMQMLLVPSVDGAL